MIQNLGNKGEVWVFSRLEQRTAFNAVHYLQRVEVYDWQFAIH